MILLTNKIIHRIHLKLKNLGQSQFKVEIDMQICVFKIPHFHLYKAIQDTVVHIKTIIGVKK